MIYVLLGSISYREYAILGVTIQVSFLLRRLRRRGEGERRGHPAPRQGALQAPWTSLLNSYYWGYIGDNWYLERGAW